MNEVFKLFDLKYIQDSGVNEYFVFRECGVFGYSKLAKKNWMLQLKIRGGASYKLSAVLAIDAEQSTHHIDTWHWEKIERWELWQQESFEL